MITNRHCINHVTRKLVPAFDHPHSKEIFPNILSAHSLVQFCAIPTCPIVVYQGEETATSFSISPPQGVAKSNEVTSQLTFPPAWTTHVSSLSPHRTCLPALLLAFLSSFQTLTIILTCFLYCEAQNCTQYSR